MTFTSEFANLANGMSQSRQVQVVEKLDSDPHIILNLWSEFREHNDNDGEAKFKHLMTVKVYTCLPGHPSLRKSSTTQTIVALHQYLLMTWYSYYVYDDY